MDLCPQCQHSSCKYQFRLIKETCGHYKCRQCLLAEEFGCKQCYDYNYYRIKHESYEMSGELFSHCHETLHPLSSSSPPTLQPPSFSHPYFYLSSPLEPVETCEVEASFSLGSLQCDSHQSELSFSRERSEPLDHRLSLVDKWILNNNFNEIDEQLNWNQNQYNDRIHDSLGDEMTATYVIQRGQSLSSGYLNKYYSQVEFKEKKVKILTTLIQEERKKSQTETSVVRKDEKTPGGKTKRKRNTINHQNYSHIIQNEQHNPPSYLCTICHRQFKNRLNIRYHIACADASAGHKCPDCPRIFKSSSHLTYHSRTAHGGVKPYKCNVCEKAFAQSVKCKRHEKTHRGELPFKCTLCSSTSNSKMALIDHESVHKIIRENKLSLDKKTHLQIGKETFCDSESGPGHLNQIHELNILNTSSSIINKELIVQGKVYVSDSDKNRQRVKDLLKNVKEEEVSKVLNGLNSREWSALIDILKVKPKVEKDKGSSSLYTGSRKKLFLNRYCKTESAGICSNESSKGFASCPDIKFPFSKFENGSIESEVGNCGNLDYELAGVSMNDSSYSTYFEELGESPCPEPLLNRDQRVKMSQSFDCILKDFPSLEKETNCLLRLGNSLIHQTPTTLKNTAAGLRKVTIFEEPEEMT